MRPLLAKPVTPARLGVLIFLAAFPIGILLWARTLTSFLVLDDNTLIVGARRTPFLIADFLPLGGWNWRPLPMFLTRVFHLIWGMHPVPYHASSVALHAATCGAAAAFARRLGMSTFAAVAVSTLMLIHPGGHFAVVQFQNLSDRCLGLMLMLTFGALWRTLGSERLPLRRNYGLFIFTVLLLLSKETAGMAGVMFLGWGWVAAKDRQLTQCERRVMLGLSAMCFGALIWAIMRQQQSDLSYTKQGLLGGMSFFRHFLNYLIAMVVPHIHVASWVPAGAIPGTVMWVVRWSFGAAWLTMICWLMWKGRRADVLLALSALAMLVIPSFLTLHSRFLYSALLFWCILIVKLLWPARRTWWVRGLAVLTVAGYVPTFYIRWDIDHYLAHARELQWITDKLRSHKPELPKEAVVIIDGHPYGKEMMQPYGAFWIWAQFPDRPKWAFAGYDPAYGVEHLSAWFTWDGANLVYKGLLTPDGK